MVLLSSARLGATAAASQGSCVPMECEKTSHLCSLPSYCYSYNRTQNKTALSPQVNRKKRPRITPTSTKTNPQSVTPHMQTTYGNMSAISGASLQVLSSHIVTSQIVLGDHFYSTPPTRPKHDELTHPQPRQSLRACCVLGRVVML